MKCPDLFEYPKKRMAESARSNLTRKTNKTNEFDRVKERVDSDYEGVENVKGQVVKNRKFLTDYHQIHLKSKTKKQKRTIERMITAEKMLKTLENFERLQTSRSPLSPNENLENDLVLSPEKANSQKYLASVAETLSTGDCFYSAIYRAADEQGLLTKINNVLEISIENEDSFIKSFRLKVGHEIRIGNLPSGMALKGRLDVYNTLIEQSTSASGYSIYIEGFPQWFKTKFKKGSDLGTREQFIKKLADEVEKPTNWVGEIEVNITTELLEKCKIRIEIHNARVGTCKDAILEKNREDYDIIHLCNEGESHYKYYSFHTSGVSSISDISYISPIVDSEEKKPAGIAFRPRVQVPYFIQDKQELKNQPVNMPVKPTKPCDKYFDPCSKEPIDKSKIIQVLSDHLKRIKNEEIVLKETKEFPKHIKTRFDLLIDILNRETPIDMSFLNFTINGQVYEALWDIILSLGAFLYKDKTLMFPRTSNFVMISKNIDGEKDITSQVESNPISYLKSRNVNMGASGTSDITFMYKDFTDSIVTDSCSAPPGISGNPTCILERPLVNESSDVKVEKRNKIFFCSSKYFNSDDKKSLPKDFDISNIFHSSKNLHIDSYEKNIVLLVNNREIVESKIKRTRHPEVAEDAKFVFGLKDLFIAHKFLFEFVHERLNGGKITEDSLKRILTPEKLGGISSLNILNLQYHQRVAVYKLCDSIQQFKRNLESGSHIINSNKFLVGIVPRGGKTYIAGGIVRDLKPQRVVILLGAFTETITQFIDDLFDCKKKGFDDFADYNVLHVRDEEKDYRIEKDKKYIFVMSVELFKTPDYFKILTDVSKTSSTDEELEKHLKDTFNLNEKYAKEIIKRWKQANKPEFTRRFLGELRGEMKEGLRADLIISDEAHLKQVTQKTKDATDKATKAVKQDEDLEVLETEEVKINYNIPIVYMTGTYIKPLKAFKIPSINTIIWDYEDVQLAKDFELNMPTFQTNFGKYHDKALAELMEIGTIQDIEATYKKFPKLCLITTHFNEKAKQQFEVQAGDKKGESSVLQLFEVQKDFNPFNGTLFPTSKWHEGFINSHGMMKLLNFLTPSSVQLLVYKGEKIPSVESAMTSADLIGQYFGDRLRHFTTHFVAHSQLWFLPKMSGNPLFKRMTALAGCIFQNKWYRDNFVILAVSSSIEWKVPNSKSNRITIDVNIGEGKKECGIFTWACPSTSKSLKQCILDEEYSARKEGKGLIILAQNMLNLGISLPCVDMVVLLDDTSNLDERIQKMYRALTQADSKKVGYIIDVNYFRTVKAIMEYQIATDESRGKIVSSNDLRDQTQRMLNLYAVDQNLNKYEAIFDETAPELTRFFKSGEGQMMISNIGDILNTNINVQLNRHFNSTHKNYLRQTKDEKNPDVRRPDGTVPVAKPIKFPKPRSNPDSPNPEPTSDENDSSLFKTSFLDIFKSILKFGVFGTSIGSLEELKSKLESDKEFQEVVYEMLVKRGDVRSDMKDSDISRLFENVVIPNLKRLIDSRSEAYSKMRKTFDSTKIDDRFASVLDYINKHLAPKDVERHKYGEVFTPLSLVDEMLSKLPKDVWSNPDLKWLDPANGMGNFPIKALMGQHSGEHRYPGLLKGLEGKKDCKWIIENMLFMIDINQKNNAIARRLFETLCPGARANIEQIDKKEGFLSNKSLAFNGKVVDKFDIIMGNPPFNRGAVRVAMVTTKTRKAKANIIGDADAESESGFWFKFVKKAIEKLLEPNGFLLFIHPITWFKPDRAGAHDLILSKQILNIRIFTDASSKKMFGGKGEITVAYYLLENKTPTKITKIINMNDGSEELKLDTNSIIIKQGNTIFQKIRAKAKLFGNGTGLKHTTIKHCDDSGKYKLITILEDNGKIKYVNSSVAHPDQNTPKLIVGGVPKPIVLYDKEGHYGLFSQGQRHYFIGENLDKINEYFKTKLSTFILKFVKFEQKFMKPSFFPDVRTINLEKINDETLADYFGFTKEERAEIEKMPLPLHPSSDYIQKINCSELKKEKLSDKNSEKTRKNPKKSKAPKPSSSERRFSKTRKLRR